MFKNTTKNTVIPFPGTNIQCSYFSVILCFGMNKFFVLGSMDDICCHMFPIVATGEVQGMFSVHDDGIEQRIHDRIVTVFNQMEKPLIHFGMAFVDNPRHDKIIVNIGFFPQIRNMVFHHNKIFE